jgi:hypothetical protein
MHGSRVKPGMTKKREQIGITHLLQANTRETFTTLFAREPYKSTRRI